MTESHGDGLERLGWLCDCFRGSVESFRGLDLRRGLVQLLSLEGCVRWSAHPIPCFAVVLDDVLCCELFLSQGSMNSQKERKGKREREREEKERERERAGDNIDNPLLLLVADALIAPVILSGLSDVDELMVALGCRFALDLFSIAQHDWTNGPPQACQCCASIFVLGLDVQAALHATSWKALSSSQLPRHRVALAAVAIGSQV